MSRFDAHARVIDVLAAPGGAVALTRRGYPLGDGFVDGLSQYQSLSEAEMSGRLRDLAGLLEELNSGPVHAGG